MRSTCAPSKRLHLERPQTIQLARCKMSHAPLCHRQAETELWGRRLAHAATRLTTGAEAPWLAVGENPSLSPDGVDDRDIHLDIDLAGLDGRRGCARRLGGAGEDDRLLRLPAPTDLDRDG